MGLPKSISQTAYRFSTAHACDQQTHRHTQRPRHICSNRPHPALVPVLWCGLIKLTTTVLHPFNGLFSRTTWVSRYQKGKTILDLNDATENRVFGRQWHQLDHMQTICTSLHTDNHTNTPSLNFLQAGCSSWCPTNCIKALKAMTVMTMMMMIRLICTLSVDSLLCELLTLHRTHKPQLHQLYAKNHAIQILHRQSHRVLYHHGLFTAV